MLYCKTKIRLGIFKFFVWKNFRAKIFSKTPSKLKNFRLRGGKQILQSPLCLRACSVVKPKIQVMALKGFWDPDQHLKLKILLVS